MIKVINQERFVYFVGDIHGEHALLMDKLHEVGFEPEKGDILVATGDIIDKGTDSFSALKLIEKDWFFSSLGNHEEMAYLAVTNPENEDFIVNWIHNGGTWYFLLPEHDRLIARDLILKTAKLPTSIEVVLKNGKRIGVVHGDYPYDHWQDVLSEDKQSVLWDRKRGSMAKHAGMGREITGIDLVVFGHCIMRQAVKVSNQIFIDTGAFLNNNLTLLSSDEIIKC